jgi:hypothetical protein
VVGGRIKTKTGWRPVHTARTFHPAVLKNYFFFFAAGFLATTFVAGFFFAATVSHLPSGVEGPRDDYVLITAGTYGWLFHH